MHNCFMNWDEKDSYSFYVTREVQQRQQYFVKDEGINVCNVNNIFIRLGILLKTNY